MLINLSEREEKKLLKTLKKHCATIGYTLDDLKGISHTLFQHKIKLEKDAKPVVNYQRRLNPKMELLVLLLLSCLLLIVWNNIC